MVSDPRLTAMDHMVDGKNHSPDRLALLRERFRPFRRYGIRTLLPVGPESWAGRETDGEFQIVQIVVRDNNVDQALKALKKKMQREGVFREMKARTAFEKPSEAKARRKAEAVRRTRKLARKRAQREGLLPKT
jgi:small subunit ribosomal protein S21